MAVFDIGQNVVSGAAGVIHGNTSIDIDATIAQHGCNGNGRNAHGAVNLNHAPVENDRNEDRHDFEANREWGSIGTNYLKGLFALAFQGFLIMVCVGIYAVSADRPCPFLE